MDYHILMADIVNSRNHNSNKLILEFRQIINHINKKWAKEIISPLTITLGDEFQGIISTSENAYKIIFDIEEEIIKNNQKLKLRYVFNIGNIDTPINKNIAYEMLGEGLTTAREKLNELKKNKNRFQIITKQNTKAQEIMNNLFRIYSSYIDNWKPSDFYIIKEFLLNKHYQEIAESLNINISSSWRRQKSLNIEAYSISKNLILNINSIMYV
jgi:SatD family (SatD)